MKMFCRFFGGPADGKLFLVDPGLVEVTVDAPIRPHVSPSAFLDPGETGYLSHRYSRRIIGRRIHRKKVRETVFVWDENPAEREKAIVAALAYYREEA